MSFATTEVENDEEHESISHRHRFSVGVAVATNHRSRFFRGSFDATVSVRDISTFIISERNYCIRDYIYYIYVHNIQIYFNHTYMNVVYVRTLHSLFLSASLDQ